MQKSQTCLGCKTTFEEGSRLPGEDLTIELKNYSYPIKDQKHRWILLKTIVSLLNSKGGTIFIGAQDKTGEVFGIQVSRKEQDQYKLFVQTLAQRIQPPVDLSNRQDIIMQFVPVVKDGAFTGRYLGKIIVKQGEPTKLYCFSQKIVIQSLTDKKYDDFDVVYSYKRINLGSVKEVSGYDVVAEAASRALNPPRVVNIFHDGCNPQPKRFPDKVSSSHDAELQSSPKPKQKTPSQQMKQVELQPKNSLQQTEGYVIEFFKVKQRKMRQKLESYLDRIMDELGITGENISYDDENDTLVVDFDGSSQWSKAMDHIDGNLDKLNQNLQGQASFVKRQADDDYAVYQNQKPQFADQCSGQLCEAKEPPVDQALETNQSKESAIKTQEAKNEKQTQKSTQKSSKSLQKQIKQGKKKQEPEYQIKVTSERKQVAKQLSSHQYINIPSNVDLGEKTTLTITHINPARKTQLIQFIKEVTTDHKNIIEYDKTVEIQFENQQGFDRLHDKLEKSKDLAKFGFKGVLRYGVNTGQISLQDYDKKKYREFKTYITKSVGEDAKRCEFFKKGEKYTLVVTLKSQQKAAKWLDKLIMDNQIKTFRIPGNDAKKMKIDLVCVKPKKSKTQSSDK